jgi:hypothetical protein
MVGKAMVIDEVVKDVRKEAIVVASKTLKELLNLSTISCQTL